MNSLTLQATNPQRDAGSSPGPASSALERLRQAGYRVTQPRVQLLRLLAEGCEQGEHLDVESLHARAQEAGMDISLATVYRTLAVFREVGLVMQHHFAHGDGRDYYEPVTNPTHHHFTCLACGQVIEFEVPDVRSLCQNVAGQLGVQVSHTSLYLEGYCPACQARRDDAP